MKLPYIKAYKDRGGENKGNKSRGGNHALKIRKEIRKFIGGEAADARKVK